jgi:hypothetical protein
MEVDISPLAKELAFALSMPNTEEAAQAMGGGQIVVYTGGGEHRFLEKHYHCAAWVNTQHADWMHEVYGWFEYAVDIPHAALIDVKAQYCCSDERPLTLSVNGQEVDQCWCAEWSGGWEPDSLVWSQAGAGPFEVQAGVTRLRMSCDRFTLRRDLRCFPSVHKLVVTWVPISPTSVPTALTCAPGLACMSRSAQAASSATPAVMPVERALRVLPDAFGVEGALCFSPLSVSSLLSCAPSTLPMLVERDDWAAEKKRGDVSGVQVRILAVHVPGGCISGFIGECSCWDRRWRGGECSGAAQSTA